MDTEKEKETREFYERLKKELDLSTTWPDLYLFKFIVPTDNENILPKSKTGKFTSISVDVMMKDSQEIIDKYIELSTIKGIISL